MAKLKGPLFSLGASQQLGKSLVFFPWKGLNVVREYVVPSNPRTPLQVTQRSYMTAAVADIHAAIASVIGGLGVTDRTAYAAWASVVQAATTWFNQACRNYIDQNIAGLTGTTYRGVIITAGVNTLTFDGYSDEVDGVVITAGDVWYGTSPTALLSSVAATLTILTNSINCIIPGLTTGVKYYMQFRPSAAAAGVGANSGIYYGYPT